MTDLQGYDLLVHRINSVCLGQTNRFKKPRGFVRINFCYVLKHYSLELTLGRRKLLFEGGKLTRRRRVK